ncbi:hypothetical protein K469DRAFT_764107 [Zopfia rhizophila CBS 207.26]|uniref:Uncharacterized protein n=1 Tax=Zopfia rhizophila CBS 207.26 TaxID=1314779 RepID=A0A6A6EBR0_9PEZI|nr:hypothetical protein K469DRAFT_764107 [Zopfia rhizophila CBS 207.26]
MSKCLDYWKSLGESQCYSNFARRHQENGLCLTWNMETLPGLLSSTDVYPAIDALDKIFALEGLLPMGLGRLLRIQANNSPVPESTWQFRAPNVYDLAAESNVLAQAGLGCFLVLDLTYSDAYYRVPSHRETATLQVACSMGSLCILDTKKVRTCSSPHQRPYFAPAFCIDNVHKTGRIPDMKGSNYISAFKQLSAASRG